MTISVLADVTGRSFSREAHSYAAASVKRSNPSMRYGMAPSSFVVLPVNRVNTSNRPDANSIDHISVVNITPFRMCVSSTSLAVIAGAASKTEGAVNSRMSSCLCNAD